MGKNRHDPSLVSFFISTNISSFISTEKENGEAAHLAIFEINGDRLYIIGSKNVHLAIRSEDDIAFYENDRFRYARRIATTLMMTIPKSAGLAEIMISEALTANFELIDPDSRHYVDYNKARIELRFLAFTSHRLNPKKDGLTRNQLSSLQIAEKFDLNTVQHRVYGVDEFPKMFDENLSRTNAEGIVVYCIDGDERTVGLWKMKTSWYTMHKTICTTLTKWNIAAIGSKIDKIGRDLNLKPAEIDKWATFGRKFPLWLKQQQRLSDLDLSDLRPIYSMLVGRFERDLEFVEISLKRKKALLFVSDFPDLIATMQDWHVIDDEISSADSLRIRLFRDSDGEIVIFRKLSVENNLSSFVRFSKQNRDSLVSVIILNETFPIPEKLKSDCLLIIERNVPIHLQMAEIANRFQLLESRINPISPPL
jgi:hypothetical protein